MTRYIILNTILVGLLIAGYMFGFLNMFLSPHIMYISIGMMALIGLGTVLAGFKKWEAADWLADKLPVLGFLGTVLGIIQAGNGVTTLDAQTLMVVFFHILSSLISNFLGMFGYLWLSLIEKVCKER